MRTNNWDSLVTEYQKQQDTKYWVRKRRRRRLSHWIGTQRFRLQELRRNRYEDASAFTSITRSILGPSVLAVMTLVAVYVVEYVTDRIGWSVLPVPSADEYLAIMTTVIQLSGAVLALYFAAITVVASTVYAEVPDDVRLLLINERFGNVYFWAIAFLGVFTVLAATAQTIGFRPSILALGLTILLTAFGLFGFVRLGLRTLDFFNPAPLLPRLRQEVLSWSTRSTPDGWMWENPDFQGHYQRQASFNIRTLQHLAQLIMKRDGMGSGAVLEVSNQLIPIVSQYSRLKLSIPTNSHWYQRVAEYKDWLLADYFEINLALATDTGLDPKSVPNHLWLEEEVAELLEGLLTDLGAEQDWNAAATFLHQWNKVFREMGNNWATSEGELLLSAMGDAVYAWIDSTTTSVEGETAEQLLGDRLLVADLFQRCYVELTLGLNNRTAASSSDQLQETVSRIDWTKSSDLYRLELPITVTQEIEQMHQMLETEGIVEGQIISPDWYLQQVIATKFASFLVSSTEHQISTIEKQFVSRAEELIRKGDVFLATQTCSRGTEAISKARSHIAVAKAKVESLGELRRNLDFYLTPLAWPQETWQETLQKLDECYGRLLVVLSQASPQLQDLRISRHYPDLLGEAFSKLAEGSFRAMQNGAVSEFGTVISGVFVSGFGAYSRTLNHLAGMDRGHLLVLATDPVLDLMELSGYALIYTELGSGEFWGIVKRKWDRFLEDPATREMRLNIMALAVEADVSNFFLSPRSVLRTAWGQSLIRDLESRGIDIEPEWHYPEERRTTPRPYPRILSTMGMLHKHMYEVFIGEYFDPANSPYTLRLPRSVQSFVTTYRQQKQND